MKITVKNCNKCPFLMFVQVVDNEGRASTSDSFHVCKIVEGHKNGSFSNPDGDIDEPKRLIEDENITPDWCPLFDEPVTITKAKLDVKYVRHFIRVDNIDIVVSINGNETLFRNAQGLGNWAHYIDGVAPEYIIPYLDKFYKKYVLTKQRRTGHP